MSSILKQRSKLSPVATMTKEAAMRYVRMIYSKIVGNYMLNPELTEENVKAIITELPEEEANALVVPFILECEELSESLIEAILVLERNLAVICGTYLMNQPKITESQKDRLVRREIRSFDECHELSIHTISETENRELLLEALERLLTVASEAKTTSQKSSTAVAYLSSIFSNPLLSTADLLATLERRKVEGELLVETAMSFFMPRLKDPSILEYSHYLNTRINKGASFSRLRERIFTYCTSEPALVGSFLKHADSLSMSEVRALVRESLQRPVYALVLSFGKLATQHRLEPAVDRIFLRVCREYLTSWAEADVYDLPEDYIMKLMESYFQTSEELIAEFPKMCFFELSESLVESAYYSDDDFDY